MLFGLNSLVLSQLPCESLFLSVGVRSSQGLLVLLLKSLGLQVSGLFSGNAGQVVGGNSLLLCQLPCDSLSIKAGLFISLGLLVLHLKSLLLFKSSLF